MTPKGMLDIFTLTIMEKRIRHYRWIQKILENDFRSKV